ncbi:hypothetical protein NKG05_00210 [Oerskovia sp. M15]
MLFSPLLGADPEKIVISGRDGDRRGRGAAGGGGRLGVPLPRVDTIGMRDRILSLNGCGTSRSSGPGRTG